jgi:THO complex subunit 4
VSSRAYVLVGWSLTLYRNSDSASSKLRVENIHYELTEDDLNVRFLYQQINGASKTHTKLQDLFNRIGPVVKLDLLYDKAGRSNGIAYVTYESAADAKEAIKEFDGANANGQPIRLFAVPTGPGGGRTRNPFDTAVRPSRPLADRITAPSGGRNPSLSPVRRTDVCNFS